MQVSWYKCPGRRKGQCKGPETEGCLGYLKKRKGRLMEDGGGEKR